MNEREAAIGAGDQIGRLSEDVAAAAIAPVGVFNDAEALGEFEILVEVNAAALRGKVLRLFGFQTRKLRSTPPNSTCACGSKDRTPP